MKRYFFTTTQPGTHVDPATQQPFHCGSAWEYLDLPNGAGYIVVMLEEVYQPDPSWTELPHLLEQTQLQAALPAGVMAALATLAGIAAADQTFHMARKLGAINPRFHP